MNHLETYTKAMIRGDTERCIAIEEQFGVFGFPPEIVSVALKAVDDGDDKDEALAAYFDAAMSAAASSSRRVDEC